MKANLRALYVFLDEGGNLDFSNTGTKYFVLTALSKERPFEAYKNLNELKYDLVEQGVEIEYFHAAEDRQVVRNSVFKIIDDRLPVQKKRRAIEKAIKKILTGRLPAGIKYKIFHHSSKSNYDLQIVDYCNWAIYRKCVTGDTRSYDIIKRVLKTERRV